MPSTSAIIHAATAGGQPPLDPHWWGFLLLLDSAPRLRATIGACTACASRDMTSTPCARWPQPTAASAAPDCRTSLHAKRPRRHSELDTLILSEEGRAQPRPKSSLGSLRNMPIGSGRALACLSAPEPCAADASSRPRLRPCGGSSASRATIVTRGIAALIERQRSPRSVAPSQPEYGAANVQVHRRITWRCPGY